MMNKLFWKQLFCKHSWRYLSGSYEVVAVYDGDRHFHDYFRVAIMCDHCLKVKKLQSGSAKESGQGYEKELEHLVRWYTGRDIELKRVSESKKGKM